MDFQNPGLRKQVAALIGGDVSSVEFPGGRSRDTVRLILEDGSAIIATSRKDAVRSTRELQLLYALHSAGVPAPRVLGVEEGFFLQSSVGGLRLTEFLQQDHPLSAKAARLESALAGLHHAQQALAASALAHQLDPVGIKREACLERAALPKRLARRLGLPAPENDLERFAEAIAPHADAPIKLDARPANALINDTDQVVWIDWDRAGRRNPADDPVSLLFDEYTAIPGDLLDNLIDRHAENFSGGRRAAQTRDYILHAGIAQCAFRLRLILSRLDKTRRWADPEVCLREDRIGSAPIYIVQLCDHALHATTTLGTLPELHRFFDTVKDMATSDPDHLLTQVLSTARTPPESAANAGNRSRSTAHSRTP